MTSMTEIASEPGIDSDAQATVTDFLDYTEYLPSDILRSLTLLRGLDETYLSSSHSVHDLAKQYATLSAPTTSNRPDPQALRAHISAELDQALLARESSYAEASRLFNVADRHYNKLHSIINKLHALPKPPSRDPTPKPSQSPEIKRSRGGRKLENGTSTHRLTLHPPRAPTAATALLHRPRGRRVTVPGEVLPPYDPDSPVASTEVSEWDSEPASPMRPIIPLLKLKTNMPPKPKPEKVPKPRAPRESTGAYKMPSPPPENAEIGSKFKPWTRLTEWEMWKLRKKMKKNINWEPSEVMIRRELAERGRGLDNYYRAQSEAQANGTKFLDVDNHDKAAGKAENMEGVPESQSLRNKGMQLNEARKEKAREKAAQAAQEAEQAARRLGDIGSAFKNLFSPLTGALASLNRSASSPNTNGSNDTVKKAASKNGKKRKLDDIDTTSSPSVEADAQRKKQKTAAPLPSPLPTSAMSDTTTTKIPLKLTLAPQSSTLSSLSTASSPTSSFITGTSQVFTKKESTPPRAASTRPPSRRSTVTASSVEPTTAGSGITIRIGRRQSTPATSLRRTPAPSETTPRDTISTAASRRSKREAPGTVTQSSQDGGAAVSISRRKTKPVKKTSTTTTTTSTSTPKAAAEPAALPTPEIRVDVDGKSELVDPDEERYCVCGDVSWGEMICCEFDENCAFGQWFHMECIGLVELPPRTVKWYCPGDRKRYKKGESTNGLVGRGIK